MFWDICHDFTYEIEIIILQCRASEEKVISAKIPKASHKRRKKEAIWNGHTLWLSEGKDMENGFVLFHAIRILLYVMMFCCLVKSFPWWYLVTQWWWSYISLVLLQKPKQTSNRRRTDPLVTLSTIFEHILNEMRDLPNVNSCHVSPVTLVIFVVVFCYRFRVWHQN
jgi:hypothetical protein